MRVYVYVYVYVCVCVCVCVYKPATWAAASANLSGRGFATHTFFTPATLAVIAVMSTDDGSGYLVV